VEPPTADSLAQRRADLLKIFGAVPKPDLPDFTAASRAMRGSGRRAWLRSGRRRAISER
jgi:hypothetical protein